ncbi:MAG: hypothetical protein HY904_15170 [Deltaproteobacteria bacterium]|nr:hypothetical protein [Deltaproteobacteria bacterium]
MSTVVVEESTAAGSAPPRVVPPRDFLRFICASLAQVEAISIANYEEAEIDACRGLVPRVAAAVEVATEIMGLVVNYYEAPGTHPAPCAEAKVGLEMDRRVASIRSAQDVADLAFIGRLALRDRREALAASVASADKWEIISIAGSACREVRKSLGALELAVCGFEGLPYTGSDYQSEVATSREVRRTYVTFCADILGSGEPGPDDVVKRVRVAATSIVKLTGRAIYPAMRVDDRILLRTLHARLMEWLRAAAQGAAGGAQAGQRLWRDIASAAEILLGVNNRAELREHDLAVVSDVITRLEAVGDPAQPLPPAELERLLPVSGRDRELDALRLRTGPVTVGELLAVLRDVRQRLAHAPTAAPAAAGSGRSLSDGDVL